MSSLTDYLRGIPGAPQIKRALNYLFTDQRTDLTKVKNDLTNLTTDLTYLRSRMASQSMTSAGLRIKGGSASAVVQAHTALYAVANGVLVTKAADTDMAALSGTVTNAKFNVFVHFIDSAGTLTTSMGTEGATLAAVVWPTFPLNKACVGFTIVNPTGTGNFVGGTTVLDDGTVTPNAVFVNTQGAFDPKTALAYVQTFTSLTLGA